MSSRIFEVKLICRKTKHVDRAGALATTTQPFTPPSIHWRKKTFYNCNIVVSPLEMLSLAVRLHMTVRLSIWLLNEAMNKKRVSTHENTFLYIFLPFAWNKKGLQDRCRLKSHSTKIVRFFMSVHKLKYIILLSKFSLWCGGYRSKYPSGP